MLKRGVAGLRLESPGWARRILSAQIELTKFNPGNDALSLARVHPNNVVEFSHNFSERFSGNLASAINNYISHLVRESGRNGVSAGEYKDERDKQITFGFEPENVGETMRRVYGGSHYK